MNDLLGCMYMIFCRVEYPTVQFYNPARPIDGVQDAVTAEREEAEEDQTEGSKQYPVRAMKEGET